MPGCSGEATCVSGFRASPSPDATRRHRPRNRRLATVRATRQSHGTQRSERLRRRGGEGRAIRWRGVAAERWELRRREKGAEGRGTVWAVSSSVGCGVSTRAALRGALRCGPGRCAASAGSTAARRHLTGRKRPGDIRAENERPLVGGEGNVTPGQGCSFEGIGSAQVPPRRAIQDLLPPRA